MEVVFHITFLKKRTCNAGSEISAVCVVCGNEKLLNFNKSLVKVCSSINNPFKVFT